MYFETNHMQTFGEIGFLTQNGYEELIEEPQFVGQRRNFPPGAWNWSEQKKNSILSTLNASNGPQSFRVRLELTFQLRGLIKVSLV